MKRLKILIDARWYGLEQRGIGRYTKELIDGLVAYQSKFDFTLIVSKQNINLVPISFKKVVAKSRWYTLAEQLEIPYIIYKVKPDYFHAVHINVPFFCHVPYILTVHDLQLLNIANQRATTLPPPLFKIKTFFARFLVKHALNQATKIIAVSHFTASEIIKVNLNLKPNIKVIWEGVTNLPAKNFRPNLLKSLKINKKYFVYCGSAYPHKNLELLIASFTDFNISAGNKFQLVLIGRNDYFYSRLQNDYNYNDVIYAGYLPDSEVAFLYKNSFAFVITSNYEGFGLSPLEAQLCGTPVLSANAGSLPEVLSDSCLSFTANDRQAIIDAFNKISSNEDLRLDLINRGRNNVQKFSWSKMVSEVIDLYTSFINYK